jgi:hypothetical protein
MKKLLPATIAAVVAWGLCAGPAAAQGPYTSPYSARPTFGNYGGGRNVTPYLDLLRGGNPASNLYLGVFSEFERRNFENLSMDNFQDIFRNLARRPTDVVTDAFQEPLIRTLPPTGHPTGFQNYGPYFNLGRRP